MPRSGHAAARRELEDLRAAINYHRRENLHDKIVSVVLPNERLPRDRWLTRSEAARLVKAAWHYREVQKGYPTGRRSRQHIARFILVALYTGTRASAVCGAAFERVSGGGYVDLDRGVFYRHPAGKRETKKRQPPVPLPPQLLAHLRRWKRQGQRFAVEWNGNPVKSIRKAFASVVQEAGLGDDVIPHTLRHTAATWLMQAGTDMWQAAGFLGMTVDVVSALRPPSPGPSVRRKGRFRAPQKAARSGGINLSLQLFANEISSEVRKRIRHRVHSRRIGSMAARKFAFVGALKMFWTTNLSNAKSPISKYQSSGSCPNEYVEVCPGN